MIWFWVSGVCATSHFISIVSQSKVPVLYADKLFALFVSIVNVILFAEGSYFIVYVFLAFPFLSFDTTVDVVLDAITSPVGNWSTISLAYPALFPSLYIASVYVTSSLSFTTTGSFLCLYVAVVPLCNVDKSIFGTLVFATFVPFTCVIYFLNAKSNSSGWLSNSVGTFSSFLVTSTIGCSFSNTILSVLSVPFNHNVFFVVVCVTSIFTFTFSTFALATVM